MPAATRKGDGCTGHGAWPPRNSTSGSANVFINGIAAHRKGDSWAVHCNNEPSCHASALAVGSATVYVNGQQLGRIGDSIDCGSAVAAGSSNVFAGG